MALKSAKLGTLAAIFTFLAFVTLFLLAMYSTVPRNILGWVALFVIGIPTWLFLEGLGEVVFSAKFFARIPGCARVAIAVPVGIVLMVIAFVVLRFGRDIITSV
jgi:hypothetical protein